MVYHRCSCFHVVRFLHVGHEAMVNKEKTGIWLGNFTPGDLWKQDFHEEDVVTYAKENDSTNICFSAFLLFDVVRRTLISR